MSLEFEETRSMVAGAAAGAAPVADSPLSVRGGIGGKLEGGGGMKRVGEVGGMMGNTAFGSFKVPGNGGAVGIAEPLVVCRLGTAGSTLSPSAPVGATEGIAA